MANEMNNNEGAGDLPKKEFEKWFNEKWLDFLEKHEGDLKKGKDVWDMFIKQASIKGMLKKFKYNPDKPE